MRVPEQTPFQLLCAWEARVREVGRTLPRSEARPEARWTGIGFFVGDERLVVPMEQVLEIGHLPRLTRVPGCKAWLRGMANLRGRLAAVADLGGFLTGSNTVVSPRTRVLEVRDEFVPVGLLVTEMAGLRHFRASQQTANQGVADWLVPYFTGRVVDDRGAWTVMDLNRIVRHPAFLHVGL
ncbi:MAG: chemotaxis protein CheW [Gammaproteobacteria bacterium]|nr:chemotaxis protein CheW [Gammaproteobacteria bacterium]